MRVCGRVDSVMRVCVSVCGYDVLQYHTQMRGASDQHVCKWLYLNDEPKPLLISWYLGGLAVVWEGRPQEMDTDLTKAPTQPQQPRRKKKLSLLTRPKNGVACSSSFIRQQKGKEATFFQTLLLVRFVFLCVCCLYCLSKIPLSLSLFSLSPVKNRSLGYTYTHSLAHSTLTHTHG